MPRKLLVGGLQRNGSVKGVKKVSPPTVPTLNVKSAQFKKSPCILNGDEQLTVDFCDSDNDYGPYCKPPRSPSNGSNHTVQPFYNGSSQNSHPMKKMTPGGGSNGQIHLAHVIVHSQPDSLPSTPSDAGHSPCLSKGRLMSGTQASLEDQGIDMNSPGRHSPGGSSGGSSISRHSLSSLDSGRASAPGSEGKVVNRRLSIQSYEGSSPQRRSYHSSSSSIASVGDDLGPGPNVAEMVLHGLPDVEVLSTWLATLHFEEYIPLFLLSGYDMPTITRMTPEDLTAIGITKPNHRRKLKAEIAKLNISDGIPEYKPDSLLEWLQLLRLEEYFDTLCQQNYNTIDKVTDLTWEDLEDIGIQKLGHQKRLLLAIKRIEDINHGRRPNLVPQTNTQLRSGGSSIGCSTFPRPSTLSDVQPLQYPSQEIAISTHRPKSSPSTDSIPEMKTFQQSPLREENLFLQAVHNSAQNIATSQHHNGITNSIISPSRVRSLESLSSDISSNMSCSELQTSSPTPLQLPPPAPAPLATAEPPKNPTKDWHVTDLDQDFEYECEGTATLNRPKGLVKLRPMAKITAKTREEIAEAIMDIPDSEFKSLINQSRTLDGWSSLDGSPRHGPATVPRSATLKRAPPPPPPKRSNSAKGERPPMEPAKEDVAPNKPKSEQTVKNNVRGPKETESIRAEEFPPPPSPLPSVVDEKSNKSSGENPEPMDELFNNPLFKQRRKDSSGSSGSVDSSALPFANEAVGTIKQKVSKPYPAIPPHGSLSSQLKAAQKAKSSNTPEKNPNPPKVNNATKVEHEYDVTPEAISPGDVIDDIENMLANLSDQLDAMLDEEVQK
ncbi:caskin-2-like isoform X1 [Argiope bruennichi]|uniref:caskin-2-like isoform X1 n=2 Tax=Argiope bruennichi TaxID=94029 RepID=UPI0024950841|nr:caskin-2-like isoform X1 [Argiope bruennichi]